LRANHVLEHQSYELVAEILREWARVLAPGGRLDIGVPDCRFVAEQWVRGEIDTAEANYWMDSGHSDRLAHRGFDARGVPLWIWDAHHPMFDAGSLRAAVEQFFDVEEPFTYDIRNLRRYGRGRAAHPRSHPGVAAGRRSGSAVAGRRPGHRRPYVQLRMAGIHA
jgi:hypothetical protein